MRLKAIFYLACCSLFFASFMNFKNARSMLEHIKTRISTSAGSLLLSICCMFVVRCVYSLSLVIHNLYI